MKWFSLIYQGDVHPSTDEKIIKKEDFSALLKAKEIIDKAQEDSEKLLENTEKKCVSLRKTAEEKGFEEGLEKLNEQILSLDEEIKALRHNLQKMVLPIALKAAKKIVSKELETFPETIVDIVLQALAPISQSHKVILYINKEDKAILEAEKPKLKEILQQVEILSIQEKADVERGGCIIQTEGGMINATIENQWKALDRAFEKYRKSS